MFVLLPNTMTSKTLPEGLHRKRKKRKDLSVGTWFKRLARHLSGGCLIVVVPKCRGGSPWPTRGRTEGQTKMMRRRELIVFSYNWLRSVIDKWNQHISPKGQWQRIGREMIGLCAGCDAEIYQEHCFKFHRCRGLGEGVYRVNLTFIVLIGCINWFPIS